MFKRKDDDIDLLTETGDTVSTTTTPKTEPQMAVTKSATDTTTATAATPTATAATNATGGYTRPAETGARTARPSTFRPAGGDAGNWNPGRPGTDYRPAGTTNVSPAAPTAPEKAKNSGRRVLTVGHDILLKGEIATCDRLVIEGAVDATLNEVHTVEISETGSFKGGAEIEDAEISGVFDGELTVRGRLVIYSTGKVRGKISYGEIEIERGGEMTGTIKSVKAEDKPAAKKTAAKVTKNEKEKEAA